MFKPILVCVFGNSGCGKNTFADQFINEGFKYIHPIGDLKEFLEDVSGLPRGSLDTPEGKNIKPFFWKNEDIHSESIHFLLKHYSCDKNDNPNNGEYFFWDLQDRFYNEILLKDGECDHDSFGDLMINAYHKMKEIDPFFSRPYVKRELTKNIDNNENTIMLAIRNQHEVDIILDLKREKEFNVEVFEIIRDDKEGLSTDDKQKEIMNKLIQKLNLELIQLENKGSLNDWIDTSKYVVKVCLTPDEMFFNYLNKNKQGGNLLV